MLGCRDRFNNRNDSPSFARVRSDPDMSGVPFVRPAPDDSSPTLLRVEDGPSPLHDPKEVLEHPNLERGAEEVGQGTCGVTHVVPSCYSGIIFTA